MSDKYTLEEIQEYWTQQSIKYGQSHASSWSDQMAIEIEIREIMKHLSNGDRVLDVGCANGFSTIQFASQKEITIRGLDYIPEMIDQAKKRLGVMKKKLLGVVEFDVGNITSLDEPPNTYDKVIVVRVLINLGQWEHQLQGLCECARVLKPGGLLILSEATIQGWKKMNSFRKEWGLPDIPMPPFNQYLDQAKLCEAISTRLHLVDIVDFSSTYYVGTRVLKPLLIKALGENIDVSNPNMEWNRWFASMPSYGDYGTQKLFIFKKPEA